jgi:hypothetical protein
VPTTWITNVPCAVGCRAASQETAPSAGAEAIRSRCAVSFRCTAAQRRKGLTRMRTPFVKRHTTPRSGVFAFFRFSGPGAVGSQLRVLT